MRAGNIAIPHPRYSVQEVPAGFEIVDSTGQDKPYLIERCNTDGVDISESRQRVAGDWCYTWNIVEMGYCGACGELRSEVSDGGTYPAVGWHHLDKLICFYCACSQED